MHMFGCACWPHIRPYNQHKLDFRSKPCIFIGYSPSHRGYKCLHLPTSRIYISRNVIFDEYVFPFQNSSPSPPTPPPNSYAILYPPFLETLTTPLTYPLPQPKLPLLPSLPKPSLRNLLFLPFHRPLLLPTLFYLLVVCR